MKMQSQKGSILILSLIFSTIFLLVLGAILSLIQVRPPQSGSTIVTIRSTGWTLTYPNLKRIVEIQYGIPSLTKFAFLTNNNVWFGQGEEVKGPLHSNGGERMEGEADSLVTSALETYICGLEHDCNNEVKPGVWGTGEIQELWKF